MAVDLNAFCSYDEVRAVLGVSAKELSDTTLALPSFTRKLRTAFNQVDATILPRFAALPDPVVTADDQAFDDACRQFAMYQAAVTAGNGMAQFSPRTITDGKAMVQRQLDSDVRTWQNAQEELEAARSVLSTLINPPVAEVTKRWISPLRIGLPASDPVTG